MKESVQKHTDQLEYTRVLLIVTACRAITYNQL